MTINIKLNPKLASIDIGNGMVRPAYKEKMSFAFIPATVRKILGLNTKLATIPDQEIMVPRNVQQVAVLFIDNLGWRFVQQFSSQFVFLNDYKYQISQLTSQFPSTTAAHATTMHTGLPVYEHGIYEWFMYHDLLNQVISPLRLNRPYDELEETLLAEHNIEEIMPTHNFFEELENEGIATNVVLPKEISNSAYNLYYNAAVSNVFGYRTLAQGLTELSYEMLVDSYKYHYFYYDGLDGVSHKHGPDSIHAQNELGNILNSIENILLRGKQYEDTLILICADHGQIEVSEDTNVYFNEELPDFENLLHREADGKPGSPIGSPRDFFLKLSAPSQASRTKNAVAKFLGNKYKVSTFEELVAEDIVMDTEIMRKRFPDLAILPHPGHSAFIKDEKFGLGKKAVHGGLSKEEMLIPLVSIAF